jgi:hypothetical protein
MTDLRYLAEFRYKPLDAARPRDSVSAELLEVRAGHSLFLPDIGDSVYVTVEPTGPDHYKVLSRSFIYHRLAQDSFCTINIVVTDLTEAERLARLKT